MARTLALAAACFAVALAVPAGEPCVFETEFPLGNAKLWMKVNSLENFRKGTPSKVDGSWSLSSAKFFGDGREWSTAEWYAIGKTPCDGLYLREEVTSHGTRWEEPGLRTEIRRVKSGYEVTVEATIYNPKTNHDKLATLSYMIFWQKTERPLPARHALRGHRPTPSRATMRILFSGFRQTKSRE